MRRGSYTKLIKNILILLLFVGIFVFVYFKFFRNNAEGDFLIDETPLHIEKIRTIAEIATVNYKDEVVIDSVEYYTTVGDKITGSFQRMVDPDELKYASGLSNIKRRLTLIIKSDVNFGFDFSNKNYKISQNDDTVWFNFPKPKILSLEMNPSQTEVFQENGIWQDYEKKIMQNKAKNKLRNNVKILDLEKKAQMNLEILMTKMINDKRKLIFYFDRK